METTRLKSDKAIRRTGGLPGGATDCPAPVWLRRCGYVGGAARRGTRLRSGGTAGGRVARDQGQNGRPVIAQQGRPGRGNGAPVGIGHSYAAGVPVDSAAGDGAPGWVEETGPYPVAGGRLNRGQTGVEQGGKVTAAEAIGNVGLVVEVAPSWYRQLSTEPGSISPSNQPEGILSRSRQRWDAGSLYPVVALPLTPFCVCTTVFRKGCFGSRRQWNPRRNGSPSTWTR